MVVQLQLHELQLVWGLEVGLSLTGQGSISPQDLDPGHGCAR